MNNMMQWCGKDTCRIQPTETALGMRYRNLTTQNQIVDWIGKVFCGFSQPEWVWFSVADYLIVDGMALQTLCFLQPFVELALQLNVSIDFGFLNRYQAGMPLDVLIAYSELLSFGLTWRVNQTAVQNTASRMKTTNKEMLTNNFFVLEDRLIKVKRITQYLGYMTASTIADSKNLVHYVFSDNREVEALNSAIEFVIQSTINDTFSIERYRIVLNKNSCREWELVQTIYVMAKHAFKQRYHNVHKSKQKGLLLKATEKVEDIKKIYYYLMKDDTYYVPASDHFTMVLKREEFVTETLVTKWEEQPPKTIERYIGPRAPFPFLQGFEPDPVMYGDNLSKIKELSPPDSVFDTEDLTRITLQHGVVKRDITSLVFKVPEYEHKGVDPRGVDALSASFRSVSRGELESYIQKILKSKEPEEHVQNLMSLMFTKKFYPRLQPEDIQKFYIEMLSPCIGNKEWKYGEQHAINCQGFTTDREIYQYYEEHIEQSSWSSSKKKKARSEFRSEARRAHRFYNKPESAPLVELITVVQPPKQVQEVVKEVKHRMKKKLVPKKLIQSEEKHSDFIAHSMPADPRIVFRGLRRRFGLQMQNCWEGKMINQVHYESLMNVHRQITNLARKINRSYMEGNPKRASELCKKKHQARERFINLYTKFENRRKWGSEHYKYKNTDPDFSVYDFKELNLRKRLLLLGGVCWSRSPINSRGKTTRICVSHKWKNHEELFKAILQ
jgi:hypothetical protein